VEDGRRTARTDGHDDQQRASRLRDRVLAIGVAAAVGRLWQAFLHVDWQVSMLAGRERAGQCRERVKQSALFCATSWHRGPPAERMDTDRIENLVMNSPELIEGARELKTVLTGPTRRASRRSRLPNLVPGISLAIGVGCLVFFSGCAVGPNYRRPTVDSPGSFRNAPVAVTTNSFADLPWWDVYQDETLKSLIYTALTNNFDVRIAAARVEQARAISVQARSQFFPSVGYDGAVSRGRNEFLGTPNPNNGNTGDAALATLGASWEIDLWGRIRRLNEAARAEFLATEEARRGVMISLVSDVALAYFELLELDLQLAIAQRTTVSFEETLRLFQDRLDGGIASRLDVARAEGALATIAARVPEVERLIALKENQINVLLGRNPGPVPRNTTLLQQAMPPEIPAGLPSALLERRPDIRAAEQRLRAANAQVGVAVADFFPRIGLTGLLGKVSPEVSAFTAGTANMWSIAAGATGPLFQGGALRARHRQAKAFWEQATLDYQRRVLGAFQEVSDALVSREKFALSRVQFDQAVRAYQEAVDVSMQRYLTGNASYFEVLEAQQLLFPAENSLARVDANQLVVIVQLYRSLGGGWNLDNPTFTSGN
jgi:outer membrane protein, multidrug efflux system